MKREGSKKFQPTFNIGSNAQQINGLLKERILKEKSNP